MVGRLTLVNSAACQPPCPSITPSSVPFRAPLSSNFMVGTMKWRSSNSWLLWYVDTEQSTTTVSRNSLWLGLQAHHAISLIAPAKTTSKGCGVPSGDEQGDRGHAEWQAEEATHSSPGIFWEKVNVSSPRAHAALVPPVACGYCMNLAMWIPITVSSLQ